jgi:predicted GNAT family acetyltransferase
MVRDNPRAQRYELEVDGVVAFTTYDRKDGVVTFIHTKVPDSLAGKGVGSALAKGALDQVRAKGEKVIARCPFIAGYIAKHAEYQDLIA